MALYFNTFPELINHRKNCPICAKPLTYQIKTFVLNNSGSIKARLENYFSETNRALSNDGKEITVEFKTDNIKQIEIEELELSIDPNANKVLCNSVEAVNTIFDLKIYCKNDTTGNEYEASGELDFDTDYNDISDIEKEGNKYRFYLASFSIKYEIYKLYNIYLEDDKPNGNMIKITNDYNVKKTSFAIAEINLDGLNNSWKEKRIDLVKENFFKFNDPKKIYARANSIFLLDEKH